MTERRPTTTLRAFEGLETRPDTSPRHLDAEWLASVSAVIGAGFGSLFGLLSFGAGLLVLATSSVGGVAPATIVRIVLVVASATCAIGVVAGALAMWRAWIKGVGLRGMAVLGVAVSTVWLLIINLALLDSGEAIRASGGVSRPGWLAPADLQVGDCLTDVPAPTYTPGERLYAVRCELSHRAQVAASFAIAPDASDVGLTEARCQASLDQLADAVQPTDQVIAVRPTDLALARGRADDALCVLTHAEDRLESAVDPPDDQLDDEPPPPDAP